MPHRNIHDCFRAICHPFRLQVCREQYSWNNMSGTESLRKITRLITTHNEEGKAVFATTVGDQADLKSVDNNSAHFGLQYCTEGFPVDMTDDKDITIYKKYSADAPGLVINNGTVLRTVEMSPGLTSPMHRTVSLDYGIVLDGDVELILDSGERRAMKPGDIAIQRGTMHAWRNMR